MRANGIGNCANCHYECAGEDLTNEEVVTRLPARAPQKWIKGEEEEKARNKESDHATVKEQCPVCSHDRASFYTMQLRSADEGQTVFYTCLKCSHKWRLNN